MKKENYGIPATLLCVALYFLAVDGSMWVSLGALIIVFALDFEDRIKKTAVQALGIVLIANCISIGIDCIESILGSSHASLSNIVDIIKNDTNQNGLGILISVIAYCRDIFRLYACAILAILSVLGKDYFIPKVQVVVDGFVSHQQAPQGQQNAYYNGQSLQGQGNVPPMNQSQIYNNQENQNNQVPPRY